MSPDVLEEGLRVRIVSLRVCSAPQQTGLFLSYTAARRALGNREGLRQGRSRSGGVEATSALINAL